MNPIRLRRGVLVGMLLACVVAAVLGILPHLRPAQARQSCDITVAAGDVNGLIAAITTANANADATTICLTASTYTLTTGPYTQDGITALPLITTPITLQGNGAILERQSADRFRLLTVDSGGDLTVQHLTLRHGLTDLRTGICGSGGAILNKGTLRLSDVTLSGNRAVDRGGAIYSHGLSLTIDESTLDSNVSSGHGGAIFIDTGTLILQNNTLVTNNRTDGATANGGGIAASGAVGVIIRSGAALLNNEAQYSGGGLYLSVSSPLTIEHGVRINGNTAHEAGGGIAVFSTNSTTLQDGVDISHNTAPSGGGIALGGGTLTLQREIRLEYNQAESGGGLYLGNGHLTVSQAKIAFNQAQTGGSVFSDDPFGSIVFSESCFLNNDDALTVISGTVYALLNWWGSADGPANPLSAGSGDAVGMWVRYAPYLISPTVLCGGDSDLTPPVLSLPTFTPSRTPIPPGFTPSPTWTPSPTSSPSHTPTATSTPSCFLLTLQGAELVNNTLQLRVSNPSAPMFISRVEVVWHKAARYPGMYADTMRLAGRPAFWLGPDTTANTFVDDHDPGWGDGGNPYLTRRIDEGGVTTWQIAFNNGPALLQDYYSLGDFNGTTLYFSNVWGGTGQNCSVTLAGYPTTTPHPSTLTFTPVPQCRDYTFDFVGFEPNGVAHFNVSNHGPSLVNITGFRLNWAHDPSAAPLDFVAVGGFNAFDPASILLWDGNTAGSPAITSASGGLPGWQNTAALEPGQTQSLWFDFDATTGALDAAAGYTEGDFTGSRLTLENSCEVVYAAPTGPTLTPTLGPTNTPSPTRTVDPAGNVESGCVPLDDPAGTILCTSQ